MVEIDVLYEGGLRARAVHLPSGSEIQTDAPKDNEGRGERFSPTDLVASALGSCMLTIMDLAARKRGWSIVGAKVRVEKHMVADPHRRIGRIRLVFDMPGTFDDHAREILRRAALTCPVKESLRPEVIVETEFRWE